MSITGRFHCSVSQYGQEQLTGATHTHELVRAEGLHVYIDGFHMGVGGDDSWTPSVKAKYCLLEPEYQWSCVLN